MGIVILGGLKGPWTVVPEGEGHGYLGAIQYDEEEDKVQCHACGKWFKQITTQHLQSAQCSGLVSNIYEYKIIFGFPQSMRLSSPSTHEKRVRNARRLIGKGSLIPGKKGDKRTANLLKKALQAKKKNDELRKKTTKRILGTESATPFFTLNQQNTCYPAQLGHALKKITQMLGRTPKITELPNELRHSLTSRYGTYNEALTVFGIEPRRYNQKRGKHRICYTDVQLLDMLRKFKEKHDREPLRSDTGPGQFLPSSQTYRNHFGSWTKAKALAGVRDSHNIPPTQRRYSNQELLDALRQFKEQHGRAPVFHDFKNGVLPDGTTYQRRFGSWSSAKKLAGV